MRCWRRVKRLYQAKTRLIQERKRGADCTGQHFCALSARAANAIFFFFFSSSFFSFLVFFSCAPRSSVQKRQRPMTRGASDVRAAPDRERECEDPPRGRAHAHRLSLVLT